MFIEKVHKCEKGRAFKSGAQVKHIEILQSPWFYELMSFQINLRGKSKASNGDAALFGGLALMFNGENHSISCGLFDSFKVDVNLICPICLVCHSVPSLSRASWIYIVLSEILNFNSELDSLESLDLFKLQRAKT